MFLWKTLRLKELQVVRREGGMSETLVSLKLFESAAQMEINHSKLDRLTQANLMALINWNSKQDLESVDLKIRKENIGDNYKD